MSRGPWTAGAVCQGPWPRPLSRKGNTVVSIPNSSCPTHNKVQCQPGAAAWSTAGELEWLRGDQDKCERNYLRSGKEPAAGCKLDNSWNTHRAGNGSSSQSGKTSQHTGQHLGSGNNLALDERLLWPCLNKA